MNPKYAIRNVPKLTKWPGLNAIKTMVSGTTMMTLNSIGTRRARSIIINKITTRAKVNSHDPVKLFVKPSSTAYGTIESLKPKAIIIAPSPKIRRGRT